MDLKPSNIKVEMFKEKQKNESPSILNNMAHRNAAKIKNENESEEIDGKRINNIETVFIKTEQYWPEDEEGDTESSLDASETGNLTKKTSIKPEPINTDEIEEIMEITPDINTDIEPIEEDSQPENTSPVPKQYKEKLHSCEICGKSFEGAWYLKRHIKTHSKGAKTHKCDICNKDFAGAWYLSRHKATHSVEKPYKCDQCPKSCAQYSNLVSHKLRHSGEKSHKCDICDRSFYRRFELVRHKRTHESDRPFTCPVCDKSFSDYAYLYRHKRLHTGVRPFKCQICDKSFAMYTTLLTHRTTHTGVRPFCCKLCGITFTMRSAFRRHLRRKHNIDPKNYSDYLDMLSPDVNTDIIIDNIDTEVDIIPKDIDNAQDIIEIV